MLSNILIIIACVGAALLFLFLVTRTSTAPSRKESNDFTGAVVAVIGTTYAVILAFTLSGVWSMFQQAQANEEQEANALVNVFRIATQLQDAECEADPGPLRSLRENTRGPRVARDGERADDAGRW